MLYASLYTLASLARMQDQTAGPGTPDQGKSPNRARKTVSLTRPVDQTKPETRKPWTGNQKQQGGWQKEISSRLGGYQLFYVCYPSVPYI